MSVAEIVGIAGGLLSLVVMIVTGIVGWMAKTIYTDLTARVVKIESRCDEVEAQGAENAKALVRTEGHGADLKDLREALGRIESRLAVVDDRLRRYLGNISTQTMPAVRDPRRDP